MKFSKKISTKIKRINFNKRSKLSLGIVAGVLLLTVASAAAYINNGSSFDKETVAGKGSSTSEASLNTPLEKTSNTEPASNKKRKSQTSSTDTETARDAEPTLGATPSGCVGCETKNAGYSIVATGTYITLAPNSNSAVYTATASDGRSLSWSGPEGGNAKVFGLTNDSSDGKSYQYYVRADSGAATGTYSMVITGLDPKTSTVVRKTITVKVQAQATFALSSQALIEDSSASSATVSVKLNRYNGHTATVYGSGKLQCPSKASISSPLSSTTDNYLYVAFSGSIGVGSTCTLSVTSYDNQGNSDNRSYSIKP